MKNSQLKTVSSNATLPEKNGKVTLSDIASLAGCGESTVSKVINNYPTGSQDTVSAVRRAISTLGYNVRPFSHRQGRRAAHKRASKSKYCQIALLTQNRIVHLKAPIYARILHAIEEELQLHDHAMLIRNLPFSDADIRVPDKIEGAILFNVLIGILIPLSCLPDNFPCLCNKFRI